MDGELVVVYDVNREEKAGELEVGAAGRTTAEALVPPPPQQASWPARG